MDAVERLNIPKGPMLAKLKAGSSVTLPDGSIVQPSEVVEPSRSGRTLLHLGDTCDSTNTMMIAKGADWVVHEATFDDAHEVRVLHLLLSCESLILSAFRHMLFRKVTARLVWPAHLLPVSKQNGCY